jgi:hypothetical protein
MSVFWDVAPCGLVVFYRSFGGACYLHHQGDDHNPDDRGSKHLGNVGKFLWRYNPENSHIYARNRQNLKSYFVFSIIWFPY